MDGLAADEGPDPVPADVTTAPAEPPFVPHLLLWGSQAAAAASLRGLTQTVGLFAQHAGPLVRALRDASSGSVSAPTSREVARDEVLELCREVAGVSWHEARRAIDEFDARTRGSTGRADGDPLRYYRVKP